MKKELKKPTHEQAVERGKKGGIRSGEVRRERKKIKDYLEIILASPEYDPTLKEMMEIMNINEEDRTQAMAITLSAIIRAKQGDMRAIEFIRDTVGEKPDLKINSKNDVNIADTKVKIYLPYNGREDSNYYGSDKEDIISEF